MVFKIKIQSLSVCVPAHKCINSCKFCVACMNNESYKNQMDSNLPFYDLYQKDYKKRLEFARDNGCNTVMLTGNVEPQQNRQFLEMFGTLNSTLSKPFRWIEMQTTGTLIDDGYLRFLRNHVGVSTISVSISSFDTKLNASICGMKHPVDLQHFCNEVKRYDFNLRLSINLTKEYDGKQPDEILSYCRDVLHADQVTFRVLYTSSNNTPQDQWIENNGASEQCIKRISEYIRSNSSVLGKLEYGAIKYSIFGMSTVVDDDCMSKLVDDTAEHYAASEKRDIGSEEYKYLILRENCKLYSQWDDEASLIF